jgi:hypothetical protein
VLERTRKLWEQQCALVGDRRELFAGVADEVDASAVLYAGSYVDIAPSFVWDSVTYVDTDRRADRFFTDVPGVEELLADAGVDPTTRSVRFISADYTEPLDIADGSVELLISLYAGFVSEHCTRYLRPGGHLLVNPSHGDAAMASIDPRYRLVAAITSRGGRYRVRRNDLDDDLVPKRDIEVTREFLHETGRGVAYTKSAFAYLFERRA